jgi:hypothetical protein
MAPNPSPTEQTKIRKTNERTQQVTENTWNDQKFPNEPNLTSENYAPTKHKEIAPQPHPPMHYLSRHDTIDKIKNTLPNIDYAAPDGTGLHEFAPEAVKRLK